MSNVLEVHNLVKDFGSFRAVDDVSFSVPQGSIVGFLGPNGAGKTTTIQMLLDLLIPTSGKIFYFGKDLKTHHEEILEKINFSSTYVSMPWRISVREGLSYTSYFYNIKDRRKRVENILKAFRLTKLQNKEVAQLSEGQRTRLILAKGFINEPQVLLLDEPTASMDPETAQYIRTFIKDYQQNHDLSILFTSHNMSEIEDVCDDVIFINQGKIIAHDTPSGLAKRIKISHVSLQIKDGLKRVTSMCEKSAIPFKLEGRFIVIDIEEKRIPDFLKQLLENGIEYNEISIDKPNLQDFFLSMTKQ